MVQLDDDHYCFACGESNPKGLHLTFEYSDDGHQAWTWFVPEKEHEGWSRILHGGITAVVMDEVCAKLVHHLGMRAVTGRLDVRYIKPAGTGERLEFRARLLRQRGRVTEVGAEARREDGTLVAKATTVMFANE